MIEEFNDVLTHVPGCCDVKLEEGSQAFALYLYKIPDRLKQGVKRNCLHKAS